MSSTETTVEPDADPPPRTDIAIIGAGPVGLFAVFQAGMLDLGCHVFDALSAIGGQCAALYPEKPIYDIPAWPRIAGQGLIDQLREQAAPFAPVYHLGAPVDQIADLPDGGFRIANAAGARIDAGAVLIAGGGGAYGPNRPPLAGIEAYEGTAVHYWVARPADFAGQRVVIAGGGDSALDWALALAEIASHVAVVHRRARFRAAAGTVSRLRQLAETVDHVDLVIPYQLAGLEGDGRRLEAVIVADLDGQTRRLPADHLLSFFGLASDLGPIAAWRLAIDHRQLVVDPTTCATSRPGIYAIGDIVTYPGKLKLILCGFSEAAMAVHAIRDRLNPDTPLHFEYSTLKGVPGRD